MAKKVKPEITSAFDLFEPSIKIIKDNLTQYFVLLVLPILFVNFDSTPKNEIGPFLTFGALLSLIFFAPLLYLETMNAKGKEVTISEAFTNGYKYFWRLIGLVLLTFVIVALGLIIIIPGIIFIRRYILSPYYLIDRNMGIREAMRTSAKETKPFSWSVYSVIGVTLLIALTSILGLPGLIASTILSVMYSLANAIRYFEIKKAYKTL